MHQSDDSSIGIGDRVRGVADNLDTIDDTPQLLPTILELPVMRSDLSPTLLALASVLRNCRRLIRNCRRYTLRHVLMCPRQFHGIGGAARCVARGIDDTSTCVTDTYRPTDIAGTWNASPVPEKVSPIPPATVGTVADS